MKNKNFKFLNMEFGKKELVIIVAVFALLIFFGSTGKFFAIAGQETTTTSLGDIVIEPKGSFSFFSAFFASNYDGKECFVDDNRAVGCSIAGRSVARYFGELGWSYYNSCAGWMSKWGCDPNKCNYINNGVCSGAAVDNQVECAFDSDCSSGKYCDVGRCKIQQVSVCVDYKAKLGSYPYKCSEQGVLYVCTSTGWSHIGDCWTRYNRPDCTIDGQITTDAYKLCKWECERNSECKSGFECREHICIAETGVEIFDEIEQRKEQLISEIEKCEAKGGEVVGNTCVIEESLIPVSLELVNQKVLNTPILGTVVKKTGFGMAILIFLLIALLVLLISYKLYKRGKK